MIFSFFFVISQRIIDTCSKPNSFVTITDSNYSSVINKNSPVFLRFVTSSCLYSGATDYYWEEASTFYPNIKFVTAECIFAAPKFCKKYESEMRSYPYFRLSDASNTKVASFHNQNSLSTSSSYYINVISQYLKMYPFDTSVIEDLMPENTNRFYKSYKYPIFLLYDSTCQEDNTFIEQWINGAVANYSTFSDYGFGKLDCSKYPDECEKWGGQYPAANVFSRSKGISSKIDSFANFYENIQSVIKFLDQSNIAAPTPIPYSSPVPDPGPDISSYTIVTEKKLEDRDIATISKRYYEVTTKTYDTEATNSPEAYKCHEVVLNESVYSDVIRLLNFYRELAGVPNTINDESLNRPCMLAALACSYNQEIQHVIPSKWKSCGGAYSNNIATIKDTLAKSNLALWTTPYSVLSMVSALMQDTGESNEGEVGHRRWFLYPYLETVGIGYYPYSKSLYSGSLYVERPSITVISVAHNPAKAGYLYPDVKFVAWPPPGPFPIHQIVASWSLTYKTFQDPSVTLDDIVIKLTRDDGTVLECERVDLIKDDKPADCLAGCLIFQLKYGSYKLITAPHEVRVQVYINKESIKEIVDYTVKFFDNLIEQKACFYNTDKNKCPTNIEEEYKFGPNEYNNFRPQGVNRAIIYVVEDIKLTQELNLDFCATIMLKSGRVQGTVNIGTSTQLDFDDPSLTDVNINADPSSSLVSGVLSTSISPKSTTIKLIKPPKTVTGFASTRALVFFGMKYLYINYQREVFSGDYVNMLFGDYSYLYNIVFNDNNEAYLTSSTILSTEYLCQGGNQYNLKECHSFDNFYETRNLKTGKKQLKVYAKQPLQLYPTSFVNNPQLIYAIFNNAQTTFEYSPTLEKKVKSIYITPMSTRNNLNLIFKVSDKCALPYYNQEIYPLMFPFQNLYLVRFLSNANLYKIPDLVGDDKAKNLVGANETEVYNETNELFTNEDGTFVYTKELSQNPLFITNRAHSTYTFTTTNSNVSIRIQPSPNTIAAPIEFYFPENTINYKSIFIMNYRSVTIKAEGSMFSKIRLLNVSQVRFVDANGHDITGIQTDVIGSERIDLASSALYDTLAFRTSSIVNLTGCKCTNAFVYDSDPVIHNLDITNLEIVNGNPSFVNCKVHGEVIVKITEECESSIQIDSQTDFVPKSLKIIIPSTSSSKKLMEFNFNIVQLLVGLNSDQLDNVLSATEILDQSGNSLNSYKVVPSLDKKGVFIAESGFNENDAPSTVNTDSFLIDYVTDLSSQYAINPPPPNTSFTDSISDPLWEDYPQFEDDTQNSEEISPSIEYTSIEIVDTETFTQKIEESSNKEEVVDSQTEEEVVTSQTGEEDNKNDENNGNSDGGKKKGLSAGGIIGIVIGIVIVVIGSLAAVILILRRKKKYEHSTDNVPDNLEDKDEKNANDENANDENAIDNNEQINNSDPI